VGIITTQKYASKHAKTAATLITSSIDLKLSYYRSFLAKSIAEASVSC